MAADALSGTITDDVAGNDAIRSTLPRVTHQSGHAVDGVRPAQTPRYGSYRTLAGAGSIVEAKPSLVQLGFDEAVRVSGGARADADVTGRHRRSGKRRALGALRPRVAAAVAP